VNVGAPGRNARKRTAERQEYRVRCSDATRQRGKDHGGDDQAQKCLELSHIVMTAAFSTAKERRKEV